MDKTNKNSTKNSSGSTPNADATQNIATKSKLKKHNHEEKSVKANTPKTKSAKESNKNKSAKEINKTNPLQQGEKSLIQNNYRNRVVVRLSKWLIIGVFILFAIALVVSFGLGSFISSLWKLDDYGSIAAYTLIVLVISLITGTCLAFWYSKVLTKATAPYVEALHKVSQCDFSVQVEDTPMLADLHVADHFNDTVRRLQNVETLRENFISDFSHEFKTPIVSISGFANLLKNPNLSESERNEYLDVIIDESRRLVKLSESVLMLSRLDGQQVSKEKYRLDEQLRQCVLMFSNECLQRNITIVPELNCSFINGSAQLNSQIWVNLLSNAVKFTSDGGEIKVTANEENDVVVVSIADNGCGMDEETKSNIFNKFYQGDKSHMTPGNGLGLSIVKKIIELTDSQIQVNSTLGKGSEFIVTLKKDA